MSYSELKDLNDLIKQTQKKIADEFHQDDISLTSEFKQEFSKWCFSTGRYVEYTDAGAIITTKNGKKIYALNQWFVLAFYAVDFLKELLRYNEFTDEIIKNNISAFEAENKSLNKVKEIYKHLRSERNTAIDDLFKRETANFLNTLCSDPVIIDSDTKLLFRFVSDKNWWCGGREIGRSGDFFASSVLAVLNLVNESSDFIATIAYAYTEDEKLADAASQLIAKNDDDEYDYPHVDLEFKTGYESLYQRNRIFFGAPGTGKSRTLNDEKDALLKGGNELNYERVTFHPDYSYASFVGTYKPVPVKDKNKNDTITYEYVPGPFMRVYVEAMKNAMEVNAAEDDKTSNRINESGGKGGKPFVLIIEEINRANTAAVFGDIFQLLDRNDDQVSEYPIHTSEDVKKYLSRELKISPDSCSEISLPDNMFIWATMNSADQGVFPMDTAFKRRWDFKYLGIDEKEHELEGKTVVLGDKKHRQRVEWNKLRKAINRFLAGQNINEDKQLGPFFIKIEADGPNYKDIKEEEFKRVFKNKVLMYLYEDAARQRRSDLFNTELFGKNTGQIPYSKVCDEFDKVGVEIFCKQISDDSKYFILTESGGENTSDIDGGTTEIESGNEENTSVVADDELTDSDTGDETDGETESPVSDKNEKEV